MGVVEEEAEHLMRNPYWVKVALQVVPDGQNPDPQMSNGQYRSDIWMNKAVLGFTSVIFVIPHEKKNCGDVVRILSAYTDDFGPGQRRNCGVEPIVGA